MRVKRLKESSEQSRARIYVRFKFRRKTEKSISRNDIPYFWLNCVNLPKSVISYNFFTYLCRQNPTIVQ